MKLIIAFSLLVASCVLAQAQAISPLPVNIRSFGAIGDGSAHLLSSRFSTLAAAQAVYPNASDLTQEIDTMAIQAAIDYCANNSNSPSACRRIQCPAGLYRISQPIFLDFPHNLRGSNAAWTTGNRPYASGVKVTYNGVPWISLANGNNDTPSESSTLWTVVGATSHGSNSYWSPDFDGEMGLKGGDPPTGCVLNATFNNDVVFWMYGNGVSVRGVDMRSPDGTSVQTCAQKPNGVGFGIAGGGTRAKFEHIGVVGFYTGVKTAADAFDQTDDLTELMKASLIGSCIGAWFSGTQSFMNTSYDSEIRANVGILSTVNSGVNVFGGNLSGSGRSGGNEAPTNTFTMTSLSVSTSTPANQFHITTTLTAGNPAIAADPYLGGTQCTARNDALSPFNNLDGCVYNAWSIVTPHFGVVPLTLSAYNQSTHVADFLIYPAYLWLEDNSWGGANGGAGSFLEELQAMGNQSVYAAELQTALWGCGIEAEGIHLESPRTATTFIQSGCTSGNGRPNHVKMPYFNGDISLRNIGPGSVGGDNSVPAAYYAQQGFPWLNLTGHTTDLIMEDINYQPPGNVMDSLEVDVDGQAPRLIWRGHAFLMNFRVSPPSTFGGGSNFIGAANGGNFTVGYIGWNSFLGAAYFDDLAASSGSGGINSLSDLFRLSGINASPMYGVRPAPWSTPCITPGQVTNMTNAASQTYSTLPMVFGGQIYKKCDWGIAASGTHFVQSIHYGYTFGRNLTTADWAGLAFTQSTRSPVVYINSSNTTFADANNVMSTMFNGLVIIPPGCSSYSTGQPPLEMIVEVHPGLKYVVVTEIRTPETGAEGHNNGPPTQSTCSGNTLNQQAFSIQQF